MVSKYASPLAGARKRYSQDFEERQASERLLVDAPDEIAVHLPEKETFSHKKCLALPCTADTQIAKSYSEEMTYLSLSLHSKIIYLVTLLLLKNTKITSKHHLKQFFLKLYFWDIWTVVCCDAFWLKYRAQSWALVAGYE